MSRKGQQGMTLLELMVALFIFAVAVGGLLKTLGESARHTEALEARYFAQQVAHNRMVELQLLKRWPTPGFRRGETHLGGRDYRWVQQVEATPDRRIRRITLSVKQAGDASLAELVAFMGQTP